MLQFASAYLTETLPHTAFFDTHSSSCSTYDELTARMPRDTSVNTNYRVRPSLASCANKSCVCCHSCRHTVLNTASQLLVPITCVGMRCNRLAQTNKISTDRSRTRKIGRLIATNVNALYPALARLLLRICVLHRRYCIRVSERARWLCLLATRARHVLPQALRTRNVLPQALRTTT